MRYVLLFLPHSDGSKLNHDRTIIDQEMAPLAPEAVGGSSTACGALAGTSLMPLRIDLCAFLLDIVTDGHRADHC